MNDTEKIAYKCTIHAPTWCDTAGIYDTKQEAENAGAEWLLNAEIDFEGSEEEFEENYGYEVEETEPEEQIYQEDQTWTLWYTDHGNGLFCFAGQKGDSIELLQFNLLPTDVKFWATGGKPDDPAVDGVGTFDDIKRGAAANQYEIVKEENGEIAVRATIRVTVPGRIEL